MLPGASPSASETILGSSAARASAEGGCARLSVSGIMQVATMPPPAQAVRCGERRTAPARREDGHGWACRLSCRWPPSCRPLKQRVCLSNGIHSAARRQRGGEGGRGWACRCCRPWPAVHSSSARCHSAARRQRGGRTGAASRAALRRLTTLLVYTDGGHRGHAHPAARSSRTVRTRRTAPARREDGSGELIGRPARWCRCQHDRLKVSIGGHRDGWPPSRHPLKQRGAEPEAHGASAEGGWVRLSRLVLQRNGPPSTRATLCAWPVSQRRKAPARREDGRG